MSELIRNCQIMMERMSDMEKLRDCLFMAGHGLWGRRPIPAGHVFGKRSFAGEVLRFFHDYASHSQIRRRIDV